MASIFTKIVNGEIPSYKIAEDNQYMAFLDVFPLKKGHVLVIPKQEVDNIFDLEPSVLAGLHLFAQKVAKGIAQAISCKKVGVVVIGLEVPHAHIHLVPIDSIADIDFTKPKLSFTKDEFEAIALSISNKMKA